MPLYKKAVNVDITEILQLPLMGHQIIHLIQWHVDVEHNLNVSDFLSLEQFCSYKI